MPEEEWNKYDRDSRIALKDEIINHPLEEFAGQCHFIAQYPDNADTRWYKMGAVCKNVDSYEEFEKQMDLYRCSEVDLCKSYLQGHYTSKRVELLREIKEKHYLS